MSCSQCIKCESMVGGYEKYCPACIKRYGVKQDENFWKTHVFSNWDRDRKAEFENDIAAMSTFHVEKNIKLETAQALREMMVYVAESATQPALAVGRKARKRHRKSK